MIIDVKTRAPCCDRAFQNKGTSTNATNFVADDPSGRPKTEKKRARCRRRRRVNNQKPFAKLIATAESQIMAPSYRLARTTRLLVNARSFVSHRIHFFSLDGQSFWPIFICLQTCIKYAKFACIRAARLATRAANRLPTLSTARFMRSSSEGTQARRLSSPTSDDEAIIDISMIEKNARESPSPTPRSIVSRLERHPRALGRSLPSSSLPQPPPACAQPASDVAAASSPSSSGAAAAARRRHSRTIVEPLAASSAFAARRRPSQRQLTFGCIAILALDALQFVALIVVMSIDVRRP